ncbi:hypothetical protein C8Q73DRAFT_793343 [Cubamyces lactineus]|nr:hypothetical protein C8Q73DRAFT_793343 [Cubamyces lactineus]
MYDSNVWPLPGKLCSLQSFRLHVRLQQHLPDSPPLSPLPQVAIVVKRCSIRHRTFGKSAFTLYNVDSPPPVKQTAAHSLPGATFLGKYLYHFTPPTPTPAIDTLWLPRRTGSTSMPLAGLLLRPDRTAEKQLSDLLARLVAGDATLPKEHQSSSAERYARQSSTDPKPPLAPLPFSVATSDPHYMLRYPSISTKGSPTENAASTMKAPQAGDFRHHDLRPTSAMGYSAILRQVIWQCGNSGNTGPSLFTGS